VPSGPAALAEMKRAHAAGQPYPLALLDAMMPEMDGYMLARHIKQHADFAGSTLLMLSSAESSMTRAREIGIAACLMKPVKQSELFNAIVTSLGHAQQRQAEPAGAAATPAGSASRRLRILLVEDNAVNQKLVVRLLEKQGHHVTVTGTGKAALAALERDAFDLALMDVQMPEMGGFEATAAIRQREQATGTHLPIIAMTAHAMKGDRERCLEAGMDGYVSKPVQARELFDVIERMVPAAAPADGQEDAAEVAVDWDKALRSVGGDREILRELVGVFLGECPQWLAELREALARADARVVRRLAHNLKGSLGQLGAGEVAAVAQRLETMALQEELAGAPEVHALLEQRLHHLQPVLAGFTEVGERGA
jgi:two-component system sensor histidine kinase/response regulator